MSATNIPNFTLSNGVKIPAIAYGTGTKWNKFRQRKEGKTPAEGIDEKLVDSIYSALNAGYTHIDTAENYETEPEVSVALSKYLKENPTKSRKDFFITTKIFKSASTPEAAVEQSLKSLGLDYVDLYLVHAPVVELYGSTLEELWPKVEELYNQGKAKAIGISNFSIEDIERLFKIAKVKPHVNQIEFSAYLQEQTPQIVEFSQKNGILIEAYGPLGAITLKDYQTAPLTPILTRLATKYNKTPAQINLRWVYQRHVLSITTSENASRQKESFEIFDFSLTQEEVDEISKVGKDFNHRQYWDRKTIDDLAKKAQEEKENEKNIPQPEAVKA